MLAPHEHQTDPRLTMKDLDIHPKTIDRVFIGFDLTKLIFLPFCDQHSSSMVFDKICCLSRRLGVRPIVERYISLEEERPLIIISKNDFSLLFNIPAEKIHAYNHDDQQSLFYHLLGNKSLFGPDQSLKSILTRLSAAIAFDLTPKGDHPTEWELETPTAEAEPAKKNASSGSKKRNHLQLSGELGSTENHSPTFFAKSPKSGDDSQQESEYSPQGVASSAEDAQWDEVLQYLADCPDLQP